MNHGLRLDLHIHSRRSPDSRMSIEAIVERAGVAGLQGFALTDHNTVAGLAELARCAARFPRLRLIPGVEVSTADGHVLVLGSTEMPPVHRPLAETCDWAAARGAVAVPSHPLRWTHGIGRRLAERAGVPALETVNGHSGPVANARAELIAARRGLGGTGGSDAHELRDVGRAYTEFPPEVDSVEDVLAALRTGRSRGSGRSIAGADRVRLALRTGLLRVGRGFRAL